MKKLLHPITKRLWKIYVAVSLLRYRRHKRFEVLMEFYLACWGCI